MIFILSVFNTSQFMPKLYHLIMPREVGIHDYDGLTSIFFFYFTLLVGVVTFMLCSNFITYSFDIGTFSCTMH